MKTMSKKLLLILTLCIACVKGNAEIDYSIKVFYEQSIGINSYGKNSTFYKPYSRKYGLQIHNVFAGFGCEEQNRKTNEYGTKYFARNIFQSMFVGTNINLHKKIAVSGIFSLGTYSDNDHYFHYRSSGWFSNFNADLQLRLLYNINKNSSLVLGYERRLGNGIYLGFNLKTNGIIDASGQIKFDSISKLLQENKLNKRYSFFIGTSTQKFGTSTYLPFEIYYKRAYDYNEYLDYSKITNEFPKQINMLTFGVSGKRNNLLSFSYSTRDYFDRGYFGEYNPNIWWNSFFLKTHDNYFRLNYNFNLLTFFEKYCYSLVYPTFGLNVFNCKRILQITNKYTLHDNSGSAYAHHSMDINMKSDFYLWQTNFGLGFRFQHIYGAVTYDFYNNYYSYASIDRTVNVYDFNPKSSSSIEKKLYSYTLPHINIKGKTDDYKEQDVKPYSLTFGFVF